MAKLMASGGSASQGRSAVGLESLSSIRGRWNSEPVSGHPSHLGHLGMFGSKRSSDSFPFLPGVSEAPGKGERICIPWRRWALRMKWMEPRQGMAEEIAQMAR